MNILEKLKQSKQEELQAMARQAIDVTYKDGDIWLVVDNIPIYRVMSNRAGEVIDCPIEQLPRQIERLRKEYINRLNN
jgi:hypothetical protein